MPEDAIRRLAERKTVSYNHLVATLERPFELRGRIVEMRPGDASLRYSYAEQLFQAGKNGEACRQLNR